MLDRDEHKKRLWLHSTGLRELASLKSFQKMNLNFYKFQFRCTDFQKIHIIFQHADINRFRKIFITDYFSLQI